MDMLNKDVMETKIIDGLKSNIPRLKQTSNLIQLNLKTIRNIQILTTTITAMKKKSDNGKDNSNIYDYPWKDDTEETNEISIKDKDGSFKVELKNKKKENGNDDVNLVFLVKNSLNYRDRLTYKNKRTMLLCKKNASAAA